MASQSTQTADAIRFTRRETPPPPAAMPASAGEAAALVRPHPTVRAPWQPGRAVISEPVVWVSPDTFHDILQVSADPLVVCERRGLFVPRYQFTTQYQGYYFTTRAAEKEMNLPPNATVISAERVEFR